MPLSVKSKLKELVRKISQSPGVYLMKDRLGRIIYVGKAKNLKKRVSTYFQTSRKFNHSQPKVASMIELIWDIETIEVKSEAEALLLEGKLIKKWKPKYNTDFVDDKRFLMIRVDVNNEMPKFRLTRLKQDEKSIYFGPFAHSGLLRKTLFHLRQKYGILLSDAHPKKIDDDRWKLYDDVRSEIFGHTNIITTDEYRQRVNSASIFLEGKSKEWLSDLKSEMQIESMNQNYEKAAEIRDLVKALGNTLLKTRKFTRENNDINKSHTASTELQNILQFDSIPKCIECFDISHISGTFVVASMVQFLNGTPNNKQYRRYKIKSFIGNDDFKAMQEVVSRRYCRLKIENKNFPDLVVIDGGKGQVSAALSAFLSNDIEPPPLIGLAKKQETIIFTDNRPPLNLPYYNEGLKLLQHMRDEAHRFANTFNADIRSKRIKETVLDDIPGLGSVRRKILLQHFGNLNKLKKASVVDISDVKNIGPNLAEMIFKFLH